MALEIVSFVVGMVVGIGIGMILASTLIAGEIEDLKKKSTASKDFTSH
jgi:hypothetical protein